MVNTRSFIVLAALTLSVAQALYGCGSSGAAAMGGAGTGSSAGGSTSATGGSSSGGASTGTGGQQTQNGGAPVGGNTATGGQGQQGGTGGTSTGGVANTGGNAGTATGGTAGVGVGVGGNPGATCSDAVLRTDPSAGKEMFKAAPIDNAFPFSAHWIGTFDGAGNVGITGMADFDNDGDLDFASGRPGGEEQWWEYCSPDHWVQHSMGSGHNSPGGGNALDVDQDGFVDVVAGDSWYKNPATPRDSAWQRYGIGTAGAEDIAVGDVSGDGIPDALWVVNSIDPEWRTPGADPTMPWPTGAGHTMTNRQQQGGAIGDVDGDGDNDILVGNQWWYRNGGQNGTIWEAVAINDPFGDASPLTTMGDIDNDGDLDFAMCTHFGGNVAWVKNLDGQGTQWELHPLGTGKAQLHSIFIFDFDNDGDLDVMSVESAGSAYIWDNDGAATFTEHTVASVARGHDARVGDVDCDGDLDVVGKPWDGSIEHVYLQNMTVENGGPALFQRPAGEVWHPTQQRMFCNLVLE